MDGIPPDSEDYAITDGQRKEKVDSFMLQANESGYIGPEGFETAMRACLV